LAVVMPCSLDGVGFEQQSGVLRASKKPEHSGNRMIRCVKLI
jgi:hypothetical protein